MLSQVIRQMVEDRLAIKVTQVLRRPAKPEDFTRFFLDNRGTLENLERKFRKEIDDTINTHLEKVKRK